MEKKKRAKPAFCVLRLTKEETAALLWSLREVGYSGSIRSGVLQDECAAIHKYSDDRPFLKNVKPVILLQRRLEGAMETKIVNYADQIWQKLNALILGKNLNLSTYIFDIELEEVINIGGKRVQFFPDGGIVIGCYEIDAETMDTLVKLRKMKQTSPKDH